MASPFLFDPYGVPLQPTTLPEGMDIFYQWPVVEPLTNWEVGTAKEASTAHELGSFDISGRLYWAMISDGRVLDGLEKRGLALRGMKVRVVPGKGQRAKTLAKRYEAWRKRMLRPEVVDEMLGQAILMGEGIAQPVWLYDEEGPDNPATKGGARKWFCPRVQTWEPTLTRWVQGPWLPFWQMPLAGPQPWLTSAGTLTAITRGSERENMSIQVPVVPGTGQWLLLTLGGDRRPWMHGRLRAIWRPWIFRHLALLAWLRFNDVHGLPIRGVKLPMGMRKTDEGQTFFKDVANLGQLATLLLPQANDAKLGGAGLELIEAKSESWKSFEAGLQWAGREITILLTGGTQNTEAEGGNYKGAEEQREIRHEVKAATAIAWSLMENEQLAEPFARLNGYTREEAPIVEYDTTPPASQLAEAKAREADARALSAAIKSWWEARRAGAEAPLQQYLEQRGFQMPDATKYGEPTDPPPAVEQVLAKAA